MTDLSPTDLLKQIAQCAWPMTSDHPWAAFADRLTTLAEQKSLPERGEGDGQAGRGTSADGLKAPQDGGPSPLSAAMEQTVQDIARSNEAFEQIRRDSIRALHDQTPIDSFPPIHSSAQAGGDGGEGG